MADDSGASGIFVIPAYFAALGVVAYGLSFYPETEPAIWWLAMLFAPPVLVTPIVLFGILLLAGVFYMVVQPIGWFVDWLHRPKWGDE